MLTNATMRNFNFLNLIQVEVIATADWPNKGKGWLRQAVPYQTVRMLNVNDKLIINSYVTLLTS